MANTEPDNGVVVCLLNIANNETVPIENFSKVSDQALEKHVVSLFQTQGDLTQFLQENFGSAKLLAHGLLSRKQAPSFGTAFIRYLQLLRRVAPRLVHVHHTSTAIAGTISRILLGVPFVVTAHNSFYHYKFSQKVVFLISFLFASGIICNSNNTRRSLPRLVRGKATVIYNGVDFAKVKRSQPENGRIADFCVGSICRMVPQKDLDTLLLGFAGFVRRNKTEDVRLLLVGDGPERNRLEQLTHELEIADKVAFTGNLKRTDAYRQLAYMDVFVVSSLFEGFCNAMGEAAGAGKAVIATDIPPLPEVIGRQNARFFPTKDTAALTATLDELYDEPMQRERLARKAQSYVTEQYSLHKSAVRHTEFYRKFIGI